MVRTTPSSCSGRRKTSTTPCPQLMESLRTSRVTLVVGILVVIFASCGLLRYHLLGLSEGGWYDESGEQNERHQVRGDIRVEVVSKSQPAPAPSGPGPEEEQEIDTRGMVELRFMGRLGNNLFEYAAARSLAERLGWSLVLKTHRANPKKYGTLLRAEGMACFPGVRGMGSPIDIREAQKLKQAGFRDLRKELADESPRVIIMQDWFQTFDLFSEHATQLRKVGRWSLGLRREAPPLVHALLHTSPESSGLEIFLKSRGAGLDAHVIRGVTLSGSGHIVVHFCGGTCERIRNLWNGQEGRRGESRGQLASRYTLAPSLQCRVPSARIVQRGKQGTLLPAILGM